MPLVISMRFVLISDTHIGGRFDELMYNKEIDIAQIRWRNWTEENWKRLSEKEIVVTAFFADEMKDFGFLVSKRVDGILTNYPFKLAKFIENMKV